MDQYCQIHYGITLTLSRNEQCFDSHDSNSSFGWWVDCLVESCIGLGSEINTMKILRTLVRRKTYKPKSRLYRTMWIAVEVCCLANWRVLGQQSSPQAQEIL